VRVLGIDCGTARTGYGVIESDGLDHFIVAAGVIRANTKASLDRRLLEIAGAIRGLIQEHAPEAAAVEEVFFSANAKTALKLAHVRGVALLAIAEAGLEMREYSALEVKVSVVGYGHADKHQVQTMVKSLLRLPAEIESEDACDALAVAICHATHESVRRQLA